MHVCVLNCLSSIWLCDFMDCSLPGPSVHGILQARILEWLAMSLGLRDLPHPGIKPASHLSPALASRFFTTLATWGKCFNIGLIILLENLYCFRFCLACVICFKVYIENKISVFLFNFCLNRKYKMKTNCLSHKLKSLINKTTTR